MNTKKRLFASGLVIALAAAGVLISGGHNVAEAGPGASPVSIVSPLPLPTTGTATVSGTVGATQSGAWNVNVSNSPAVSLAGTPTVNANVTFPANQGVTVAGAGPLTNVGRLPSKHVTLVSTGPLQCPSRWYQVAADDTASCFDMANHGGEVLVITDFSWLASTNPGATCALQIASPQWPHFTSAAPGGSDGFAAKSEHLTTGTTMTVNPAILLSFFVGAPPCNFLVGTITGYLMPNQ